MYQRPSHPVTLRLVGGSAERFKAFITALIDFRKGDRAGLLPRVDGSVKSSDVGPSDFEGDVWEVSSQFPDLTIGMASRRGREPWESVCLRDGKIVGDSLWGPKKRSPRTPATQPTQVEAARPGVHDAVIEQEYF